METAAGATVLANKWPNRSPLLTLQALMGHSTPVVTMIYARLNTEELQRVYNRYAAWGDKEGH